MQKSSVLHQLNSACINGATTLGVLVHDSCLDVLSQVANDDGRVDWVVVVVHSHLSCQSEVRAEVLDTLLHL